MMHLNRKWVQINTRTHKYVTQIQRGDLLLQIANVETSGLTDGNKTRSHADAYKHDDEYIFAP
jgi:hypothetical protein